jgi:Tfp pilus assembly protein PilX
MRLSNFIRLLRRQDGIALVMAIGILGVLTISGTTLVYYSTANARSAEFSQDNSSAYDLAEAGINEMAAILNNPDPDYNALNKYSLGEQPNGTVVKTIHTYEGGTVTWWGTLTQTILGTSTWNLTSVGEIKNPTGATRKVSRTLTAKVPVVPTYTQPLNNPAWNYVYSTKPASPLPTCDMTLGQSVTIGSPLYVNGNLCLQNTSSITNGPLIVKGRVTLSQSQNTVGSSTARIKEAHLGNGCQWKNNPVHTPCLGDVDNIWVQPGKLFSTAPDIAPPTADWDGWYLNASPGPYYPCLQVSGVAPTGSWATAFDNDQGSAATPSIAHRNWSLKAVPQTFNLTPNQSYSCKTASGELSWNATTKVLTVAGTIFIDGSAMIQNGAVNTYNGQATLYLSGTYFQKNSKLCAGLNAAGTDCDHASWNPNTEMLCIVANGSGVDQTGMNSTNSAQFVSATFQGAVFGTADVETDTTASIDGPVVGSTVKLGQSVSTSFPTISVVPAGMPSNSTVHSTPMPPQLYSG